MVPPSLEPLMPGSGFSGRETLNPQSAEFNTRLEFNKLIIDLSTLLLNSGGLAIKAGSSALAKTVNVVDYAINGVLYTLAAGDMAALSGVIAQNTFGGWVFTVNAAGTLASRFMTAGASLAAVVMPAVPATDAILGLVRLNPTAGAFTGGTTALDAANTNAIYRDTPFNARLALATGAAVAGPVTAIGAG